MPSEPNQKKRILLASVLKPVDEPRGFERMGHSLAQQGFEVFIAGFPPSSDQTITGVELCSHRTFARISLARLKVRFRILGKAFSLKPDVFIICTHELIGAALLFRLFTGKKIVYDVQENYWRNIIYTNSWPTWLRPLIAFPVRWKEWITAPLFAKFLLAEKCYQHELIFARENSVIIENKCKLPPGFRRQPLDKVTQLIFTGTAGEATGVFEAVELAAKLHQINRSVCLHIVGHFPQAKTLEKVKAQISKKPFIKLTGGTDVVPHSKIFEAISTAHFGIVSYPPSPHTKDKIPTKLYEYLACQLPILLQNNATWVNLCVPCKAAIAIDFQKPDAEEILRVMRNTKFYSRSPENVDWQGEETQFLTTIRSLL